MWQTTGGTRNRLTGQNQQFYVMAAKVGTKHAAGVVLLMALALDHGCCQSQLCSPVQATSCYWSIAVKHIIRDVVSQLGAETSHLKKLCSLKKPLPPVSECVQFYAGCSEEVRKHFLVQEHGYRIVQKDLMDEAKCHGLDVLNTCIETVTLLQRCRITIIHGPTVENAEKNLNSARRLASCLIDVLRPCSSGEHYYAWNHITNFYALALTELFWYDSVSVPHAVPSIVQPKKIEFNDTDTNPTLVLQSGTAGLISLGLSGLTLITILGIYTV